MKTTHRDYGVVIRDNHGKNGTTNVFNRLVQRTDQRTGEVRICALQPNCNYQSVNEIVVNKDTGMRAVSTKSVAFIGFRIADVEEGVRVLNQLASNNGQYEWTIAPLLAIYSENKEAVPA